MYAPFCPPVTVISPTTFEHPCWNIVVISPRRVGYGEKLADVLWIWPSLRFVQAVNENNTAWSVEPAYVFVSLNVAPWQRSLNPTRFVNAHIAAVVGVSANAAVAGATLYMAVGIYAAPPPAALIAAAHRPKAAVSSVEPSPFAPY